jgi:hypothetical protein
MKTSIVITSLFILGASFNSPVQADIGIPYVEFFTSATTEEVSLFILPDASGTPLAFAQTFGGATADARLTARLTDFGGQPIFNYPFEDLWLDSGAATQYWCYSWGFAADGNTNSNGEVAFTNPLAGGGWSEGPTWMYIAGSKAYDQFVELPPVAIRFNSADINADGAVDLTDLALFASDFYEAYAYRSDFNWDGTLNMSDLAKFATGLGSSCP